MVILQRRCLIGKTVDGKWYLQLGNFEHAKSSEDCTFYGPFDNIDQVRDELDNHVDPGCIRMDDSGTLPVPEYSITVL